MAAQHPLCNIHKNIDKFQESCLKMYESCESNMD